jgi:transposase InsO family protein
MTFSTEYTIRNATVLTMDEELGDFRRGDIHVRDGDRESPRFLIHDRDGRYGAVFDRRVRALGITQIRTPFRSPQANSIAEHRVGSLRRECLDYVFVFNERHLRAVLVEYVRYFNRWRPHRAIGQRAPCVVELPISKATMRRSSGARAWRLASRLSSGGMTLRTKYLRPTALEERTWHHALSRSSAFRGSQFPKKISPLMAVSPRLRN